MLTRLAAIVAVLACCQPVLAMDLMDLYREAKANDARFAAARAQFRVMQERVPQAKAGVLPRASVGVDRQYFRGSVNGGLSSSDLQRSYYNARDNYRARTGGSNRN